MTIAYAHTCEDTVCPNDYAHLSHFVVILLGNGYFYPYAFTVTRIQRAIVTNHRLIKLQPHKSRENCIKDTLTILSISTRVYMFFHFALLITPHQKCYIVKIVFFDGIQEGANHLFKLKGCLAIWFVLKIYDY